jgi:hypothetical protein
VLVLRELYDLPGTQAAALVYLRRRIAASDRPDRVLDAVAELIAATGILRGRRRRCMDSTVLDDAVATQDTVAQLMAAIRKVARVVPGAGGVIAAVGVQTGRLRLLADYLELDWAWLSRRCAGLGRVGCARLIQPHSRLLSTEGVDAALRFAGRIAATEAAGTR